MQADGEARGYRVYGRRPEAEAVNCGASWWRRCWDLLEIDLEVCLGGWLIAAVL